MVEHLQDQRPYWDEAAARKTFTHPIDRDWLARFVPTSARVLDYGCGYGRAMADLSSLGYANLVGLDFSPAMIERGRRTHPSLDLRVVDKLPTGDPNASFDAALLLAVLTSVPDSSEQEAIMREVRRLLRPGGLLYVSDMPLQTDRRNIERYEQGAAEFGTYGIFRTADGAVVRHQDESRLRYLLDGFDVLESRDVGLHTMNGHAATAIQMIVRRR